MRKHGGTSSRRDKHVTPAAISPPGVARGRNVGGQQSGLAGCKPPPLFTRGASSCSSQGRRQVESWGPSPRPSAPTYLPTWVYDFMRCHLPCPSSRTSVRSVGHPPSPPFCPPCRRPGLFSAFSAALCFVNCHFCFLFSLSVDTSSPSNSRAFCSETSCPCISISLPWRHTCNLSTRYGSLSSSSSP